MDYRRLFSLKGKNAVVTGAVGILGRCFCSALAQYGANVAVVDLNQSKVDAFAEQISNDFGVRAVGVRCDVSDENSVNSMVKSVMKEFGRVDILVNNAASKSDDLDAFFASFEDYSLDEWRKIMAVNIDGMFLVAQRIGHEMCSNEYGGSIIQIASIYGIVAPDHRIYEGSLYLGNREISSPAVYTVSKAGVIGLTKYLATHWAEKRIRVNSISPGGVESGQNTRFVRQYSQRVPMNRMARAHEMVGALIYLASDASSYVTGQNIVVDGGLSAW